MAVDPVSLAVTAALTAANMALSAMQTFEGPRVKSAPGTVADYGTSLNYFLGTRMLSAPCFFAKPIREERKERKGKGGKQVSYTGYGSFAAHISDHEIGAVLQIWFDNHLVYDNTGSSEKIYPLADDYELEAHMRIYLGTETQDPDPDMLAYIEDRDGAGTCPAYRGTSYVYFEDIPLEMLGNRYPDVKILAATNNVEIEFVGQQQIDNPGAGDATVDFALTDGTDATPQPGDLVIVANTGSRYPTDTGDQYLGGVEGYTPFTPQFEAESLLLDMKFRGFYKRMGSVPDASITVGGGDGENGTSDCNVFQIMVFRYVSALSPLAGDISVLSGSGGATYDLPLIDMGIVEDFDPGTIGGTDSTAGHHCFYCFALSPAAGSWPMPVVIGGQNGGGGEETAGNMSAIFQFDGTVASGTRYVRAYGLYGPPEDTEGPPTLATLLTFVSQRAGLQGDEYDYGDVGTSEYQFDGFNWTQGTGRQICEAMCDIYDADIRPHEFKVQALPRGSTSAGTIPTTEFAANDDAPYVLPDTSEVALPAHVFLTYSDTTAGQNPNVAMPQGGEASGGEVSIDMQTLALAPTRAQQLIERRQRRERFGRVSAEFSLTRQRFDIEPGDVYTPSFDGEAMVMRCTKITIGADGRFPTEWKRDDPAIAGNPSSTGAPASGIITDTIPDGIASVGYVLDTAYLVDAHDQSAPLVYLAAGPAEPGIWTGADYALSDTGDLDSYAQGWDGIVSNAGSVIGTVAGTLPDVEYPWVPDLGSSISVTINAGELTAATLDELILDGTRNLAAIRSGDGWELVQFMTPTLTGELTYTITGFLRGVRGTEWAMAGHAASDAFVLLDNAKVRTLGASEIGDEDFYIVSTVGAAVDQTEAFSVDYTGASHKPYAPVHGVLTFDTGVSDDITIDAERRTRIGGSTLDGQDVPLGEASESWSADIYDGVTFKRTITGTSLPLTYTSAQQTTDFGSPVTTGFEVYLYQVNPTLSLRGYPLELAA